MADIIFGEDLPSWMGTRSTARRFRLGFFSQTPVVAEETDTAFAMTVQLFPPLRRTVTLPASSLQARTATLST